MFPCKLEKLVNRFGFLSKFEARKWLNQGNQRWSNLVSHAVYSKLQEIKASDKGFETWDTFV